MAKRPDKPVYSFIRRGKVQRGHRMPVPLDRQLDERTMPVPFCGCLIWLGGTTERGYGKMTFEYKTLLAHRVSWELRHGPIPHGLLICHRCDTPACVNPDHLFLGTPQDNMDDMAAKGRSKPPRTFSEDEVRLIRSTARQTMALAERFGVSRTTIKQIRSGRTYTHVS
jgi:hypothetical protein